MPTIPIICYKLKTPIVYNRGTKYEKTCDTFLACYGFADKERNKQYVNLLNEVTEAREEFCDKHLLNADNIAYFYHDEQEPFDTRGE